MARERERDLLFEALCEACGWDWKDMTRTSRGRVNQALMELREIDAQPEQILAARRAWQAMYEGATFTPQALVAHWPELMKWLRGARSAYGVDPVDSFRAGLEKAGFHEQPPELMAATVESFLDGGDDVTPHPGGTNTTDSGRDW